MHTPPGRYMFAQRGGRGMGDFQGVTPIPGPQGEPAMDRSRLGTTSGNLGSQPAPCLSTERILSPGIQGG